MRLTRPGPLRGWASPLQLSAALAGTACSLLPLQSPTWARHRLPALSQSWREGAGSGGGGCPLAARLAPAGGRLLGRSLSLRPLRPPRSAALQVCPHVHPGGGRPADPQVCVAALPPRTPPTVVPLIPEFPACKPEHAGRHHAASCAPPRWVRLVTAPAVLLGFLGAGFRCWESGPAEVPAPRCRPVHRAVRQRDCQAQRGQLGGYPQGTGALGLGLPDYNFYSHPIGQSKSRGQGLHQCAGQELSHLQWAGPAVTPGGAGLTSACTFHPKPLPTLPVTHLEVLVLCPVASVGRACLCHFFVTTFCGKTHVIYHLQVRNVISPN